ncbi:MAG: serine/threonine protein kinase [Planctomycetia bacterium]|nr:serine/threonine protein kinase [Planctomycetia bacterium]
MAIVSDVVGRGTSTLLSILARMHERSHRVIWCDFEEISSVSALVSHILREMQSSDPHLTPLLLAHEAGGDEASSTTTNFRPLHGMHDPRISRLFDALRRGKYFIAIDSMGEFGRSQVGHDLSEPSTKVDLRYAQVCSFLAAIAERGGELGESRVAFVHSPVIIPESDATAVPQSPISSNEAVILGDGPGEIDPATPTQFPHPAVQPLNRSPESPAAEQQEPPEQRQGGETPDPSLPKSQDESSVRDGLGETAIYPHPGMENFPMPQRIGGHEVRGELARGKQGIVYKVFHEAFGRHLAAKLLFPTSREKIEDLLNEARKAVQLDHPNIVRVFDARVDDECKLPFILYEYVTGGRLIDHMSPLSAGLSLFERMRIVAEVAAALHHAHTAAKPIIHRDVKPDNILLDHHSHAKVVDFGLAISEGDNMQLGGGALRYMSPEQIRQITKLLEPAHQKSYPVGPASDIYSLGVVMFELLTGQTPYAVPMPLEEWNRLLFPRQLQAWQQLIERDEVPSAIQIENRVPKPLDHICWKCLQLNAEGRYRTAQELANAVCAWLESTETTEATTVQQRIWREYHKLKDELARLSTSPANDGDQQRHPDQSSARMDHSAFPVRQTAVEYAPAAIAYRDSGTERGLTKILEPGANLEVIWKQIVGQGNSAIAAARVVWESLKFDHQAVLVVAAAFRRPRSIVALRRIGGILLQSGGNPSSEHVLRILTRLGPGDLDRGISRERTWATPESSLAAGMQTDTKLSNGFSATDAEVEKRIDGVLADLEEANLLIRQEGGFYWMHCAVRDAIFRECSRLEPQGMANLHEQIAYFYYEAVFRPTRDARAFNEFVAHQLLAIRESPPSNRVERLRSLRNCLDRERANLLGRTHPETLLDWVRTIRDVELPRLERGRSANAPADGAAKSVFDDLRASLCDLEGDVHQYSTNYEAGIAVRLKQISDRIEVLQRWMSEKPDRKWIDQARDKLVAKNYHPVTDAFFQDFSQRLVDCLKKVLSEGPGNDSAESINENISRLGAVLPGMLKKLLSEKVPDGYPESAHAEFCDELAADLVQSLMTSCDDKLSDGICEAAKAAWSHLFSLKLAAAMKQSFFEQLSVEIVSSMKSLCTSLASARAADAKASAGLSARTSYDQRVECVDARQSAATDTYRRYVQHVRDIAVCLQGLHYPREARTLFELIKSEVEPFCQALTAVAGDSPRASPGLRNWSARLACSCSLRLMDSWSGDVYTWDSLEQPEKQLSLDNVDREYGKAIQSLKYYSGDLRADFARNVCSLRALFARTHYLNGRFVEAHSQLDVAEASVHPENGANERMALAVCELRRAECMMLEADALCRKSSPEEGAALARNRLNLAGTSLEHAWQLLSAEPGHVWRWSLFFLERTQLIHEELLYTYLMETCDGDLAQKERRGQLIRRGLSSISSALDNIEKDRKRWKHLEILWWQFYLCFLFGRDLQLLDAWPDWKTRNANAGLDWFFEQQANHSYSRLQPLIDASIEEIRNRKVTRPKEVTLREIIIAFQRTVIGPSGRSASLR